MGLFPWELSRASVSDEETPANVCHPAMTDCRLIQYNSCCIMTPIIPFRAWLSEDAEKGTTDGDGRVQQRKTGGQKNRGSMQHPHSLASWLAERLHGHDCSSISHNATSALSALPVTRFHPTPSQKHIRHQGERKRSHLEEGHTTEQSLIRVQRQDFLIYAAFWFGLLEPYYVDLSVHAARRFCTNRARSWSGGIQITLDVAM